MPAPTAPLLAPMAVASAPRGSLPQWQAEAPAVVGPERVARDAQVGKQQTRYSEGGEAVQAGGQPWPVLAIL